MHSPMRSAFHNDIGVDEVGRGLINHTALAAARAWIVGVGLTSDDAASLLTGTSERLLAAGVPIMRTHISFATLDPRKRAENIVWLRGHPIP